MQLSEGMLSAKDGVPAIVIVKCAFLSVYCN